MEQQTNVTKDELKVALLENNEKLVQKFNDSIEKSAAKITQAVKDKTDPFVQNFTELAEKVGVQRGKIENLEVKLSNIWGKMIGIAAACTVFGGVLGFLAGKFIH